MADTAIPTFYHVSPTGEVTVEIEGVIKALGLTMPESKTFMEAEKQSVIQWLDESNNVQERIVGQKNNSNSQLLLETNRSMTRPRSFIQLLSRGSNAAKTSSIEADLTLRTFAGEKIGEFEGALETNLGSIGPEFSTTIMDFLTRSRFLQLVPPLEQWTCNFAVNTIKFNASNLATPTVVSHGLGVTPQIVIATVKENGTSTIICNAGSFNAVNFTLFGYYVPGGAINNLVSINWFAIG